jgi:predicted TPR repeat methyltransferase
MGDPPPAFIILTSAAEERRADEEEVVVRFADDGHEERVRVQDYKRVYAVAGLYEAIVQDRLRCQSPDRVASMLARAARELGRAPRSVRVLDLGAGNGVSGHALAAHGLQPVLAIDTEPAARAAAIRDRPGLYEAYLMADVLALTPAEVRTIRALAPDALACVGAIGLDHVPPAALPAALELLADDSLLAYTLSEANRTVDGAEISARLGEIAERWRIDELARDRYRHRLTVTGDPIWWEAVVLRARRR